MPLADPPPSPPASQTEQSSLRLLWRLIKLGLRYRDRCAVVVLLNMAVVALTLACVGATGLGIDYLRFQVDDNAPQPRLPFGLSFPESLSPIQVVTAISLSILLLAVFAAVLQHLAATAGARLSERVLIHLRTAVYAKLQQLSFHFYDAGESSSIINRAAGDASAVRQFVDGVLIKVLSVALTLLVYLVYMFSMHVPLTLACLATTPLLWVGSVMFSRLVQPAYRRASQLGDELIRILVETVQGAHVVKGFAREPRQIDLFETATHRIQDQKRDIFHRVSTFQPVMGFLTQINMLVLIAYGGTLVIRGQLALGAGLFVFANLLQEFAGQVGQIVNIANTIQASLISASRVFEVLDAPVDIESPANALPLPRAVGHVEFQHVDFAYRPGQPVLRDISFAVKPGERLGITGETGSGKSTLLSLVMRFYDATHGQVTIDGHDVRTLDLDDLRRNIGLVFQESFLFSHTVAANIAFGRPEATDEEIERAAELASAADFIAELPDGDDTIVGEYGANLSGGQRQRLALARALLLDPPLLLLDDATAAVDPETEFEIEQAIAQAMQGRTTLVVSNRIATLRRADRILVLERGRITAVGTHSELLHTSDYYRALAELQFVEIATAAGGPAPARPPRRPAGSHSGGTA